MWPNSSNKDSEQEDKNIFLNLTVEEINMIIKSLSKEPFGQVYKLIEKIHVQVNEEPKQ